MLFVFHISIEVKIPQIYMLMEIIQHSLDGGPLIFIDESERKWVKFQIKKKWCSNIFFSWDF
jgi:hypothetical protein